MWQKMTRYKHTKIEDKEVRNMEKTTKEVNWSEVNKEEAELACLGDMCCWKEAD